MITFPTEQNVCSIALQGLEIYGVWNRMSFPTVDPRQFNVAPIDKIFSEWANFMKIYIEVGVLHRLGNCNISLRLWGSLVLVRAAHIAVYFMRKHKCL
jgi:hypothetical protein